MTRLRIVARTFLVLLALAAAPENSQAEPVVYKDISPGWCSWEDYPDNSEGLGLCFIGNDGWGWETMTYRECVQWCFILIPVSL